MWEEIRSWTCFIGAILTIRSLIIKYYKKNAPNLVVQPKKIFDFIYVYTPLFMAILVPITGLLLLILAPIAFEIEHLLHDDLYKAYSVHYMFILLAVCSVPLSSVLYQEYKSAKNQTSLFIV